MLRPVCLLLLLVLSIYSSDLQFHNLLLNCDMPCLFFSCLVYVLWYASGGRLEIWKSLPVFPIWSGFLAQLPPFSCVEFTVTGLFVNLWSDCATQSTVTVWGDGPPPTPRSPRPGTLPQPADSAAPCTYPEGSFVFLTLRRGHWGFPSNPRRLLAFWLWCCYSNNSESNKQPVVQAPSLNIIVSTF